ncbi:MAG TPA: sulfate ABC transporter permease subunit CysT [Gaiellaceae bacterium]|nr:sulfate ABC transporter permease subunit CysT [Gaiellaceae bacterium]
MASVAQPVGTIARSRGRERAGTALSLGFVTLFLTIVVVLPIAALVSASRSEGLSGFWDAVTAPEAVAALKLTVGMAVVVALTNAVAGTLIAWVLVRDQFPGKSVVNAIIDLPFALPTIVAGLLVLALYGPRSPIGVHAAYTRWSIYLVLLFVTLPFVVRTVQPVLLELDTQMEEAARSLGAHELKVFNRIVLPSIFPGILSGVAMAFARACGEIGAIVILSGNLPYKTEVASVYVFNQNQTGNGQAAAAVAVVLLLISFVVLLAIGGVRRMATRFERA